MRSTSTPTLTIFKTRNWAAFPAFVDLAQRHFEKERPNGREEGSNRAFTVPVDLLRMVLPPRLVDELVEVEIVYGK